MGLVELNILPISKINVHVLITLRANRVLIGCLYRVLNRAILHIIYSTGIIKGHFCEIRKENGKIQCQLLVTLYYIRTINVFLHCLNLKKNLRLKNNGLYIMRYK